MAAYQKARSLLMGTALTGVLVSPVFAQYTGPSAMPTTSVADILKNPVDDQDVQLQGHIVRQTSREHYIFSDGTGEIVLEIEAKRFSGQSVDERTKVEIIGEVDTGRKRLPQIEVDSVRILK